ncbi:MAG TPA: ferredoxin, partial [Nitrospirota bacterium]
MAPLIQIRTISLPPPSDDDRRAHDQRVRDTLGLADLDMPLSVLRRLPRLVHERAAFPCVVGSREQGRRLIDIGSARSFSLALDIGTTNLVAALIDNTDQQRVLTKSVENPQIKFGSDIITRLHHAMSPAASDVYQSLLDGINAMIDRICGEAGIVPHDIHAMVVAGNTVMTHFFLGLDVSTIPVDPFVPVVRSPGFFIASELGLAINPEAIVYAFPNAGSYVGGDITAGILASGMF